MDAAWLDASFELLRTCQHLLPKQGYTQDLMAIPDIECKPTENVYTICEKILQK